MRVRAGATAVLRGLLVFVAACGSDADAKTALDSPDADHQSVTPTEVRQDAGADERFSADTIPLAGVETEEDWVVLEDRVRWAREQGLDTVPLGRTIAELGRTFVGAPYTPGTLEAPGPEALVVNLREFDCVTFVESMVAMARVIRDPALLLDDTAALRDGYIRALATLRYRDASLNGYSSRLHYFSEWISDNTARGQFQNLTSNLDPAFDAEPIDFMSSHPDAYRQLADPVELEAIRDIETRLNSGPRPWIPEARIADVADSIQDGDIIAATSTVEGLDIAHTGIALWVDGALHLMHAPLVGKSVEISSRPLADRILGFSSQDGIMVARPLERS